MVLREYNYHTTLTLKSKGKAWNSDQILYGVVGSYKAIGKLAVKTLLYKALHMLREKAGFCQLIDVKVLGICCCTII